MKCPNCGYNSFDYLEECKKCKLPLNPSEEFKSLYKEVPKKALKKTKQGTAGKYDPVAKSYFKDTVDSGSSQLNADVKEHRVNAAMSEGASDYSKEREEHELQSASGELNPESQSHGISDIGAGTPIPELDPDPLAYDATERKTSDPELYSESNYQQEATNLADQRDTKEDLDSYSIASLKQRAGAFVIDITIVGLIAYLTIGAGFFIVGNDGLSQREFGRVFLPVYALLFFLASTYFVFLHYYAGKTLGKMVVGIRVISSDARDPGLRESFMRWVGYYISAVFMFAGFLWSMFDRDSQAWHDKIAGTYVVIG